MPETRALFHSRVEELERRVLEIGDDVRRSIGEAVDAWLRLDAAAGRVIDARRDIWTERAKYVEQAAYELIATQQPMATDLRRLVSLIRLAEEVARSGALVAHIARSAGFDRRLESFPTPVRGAIADMARIADELWRRALEGYTAGDAMTAADLATADDELDSIQRELFDRLITDHVDPACAVDLALLGRYLERLGDHAVDIAARAGFVATGEIPRPS